MKPIFGLTIAALIVAACSTGTESSTDATTTTKAAAPTTTVVPATTTTVAPTTTEPPAPPPPPPTTVFVPPPPPIPEPQPVLPEPQQEITQISGSVQDMVCATFGSQCQKALSVVQCESNFNPGVVGAAGERGLFQIHPVHIQYLGGFGGWDAMFDPAANIAYAYDLYSRQGWGPWTCA